MATLTKIAGDNYKVQRAFIKPKYDWVTAMMKSYQEQNPYQNLTDRDLLYLENAFRPDSPVGKYVWNTYKASKVICDFLLFVSGNPIAPSRNGFGNDANGFVYANGFYNTIDVYNSATTPNYSAINAGKFSLDDYFPMYYIRDYGENNTLVPAVVNLINSTYFNAEIEFPTYSYFNNVGGYLQMDSQRAKGTFYLADLTRYGNSNPYYVAYRCYSSVNGTFEDVVFENENVIDAITSFILFNNRIPTERINYILEEFYQSQLRNPRLGTKVIQINSSYISNAPTGAGLTAKQNLIDAGWTVNTN